MCNVGCLFIYNTISTSSLKQEGKEGLTVVNITHFMEEAVLADRVVVMEHGRIVALGTPREVFSQVDLLKRMQLDVPPITELAALLHKEKNYIAADIMTIEEMVNALCR